MPVVRNPVWSRQLPQGRVSHRQPRSRPADELGVAEGEQVTDDVGGGSHLYGSLSISARGLKSNSRRVVVVADLYGDGEHPGGREDVLAGERPIGEGQRRRRRAVAPFDGGRPLVGAGIGERAGQRQRGPDVERDERQLGDVRRDVDDLDLVASGVRRPRNVDHPHTDVEHGVVIACHGHRRGRPVVVLAVAACLVYFGYQNYLRGFGSFRLPSMTPIASLYAAIPLSGALIFLFTVEQLVNGCRHGFENAEPGEDARATPEIEPWR